MENKENERATTRIPIPIKPLPELPKHLLKKHVDGELRRPLKTIGQTNVLPGSSGSTSQKIVLDTRHVTLRGETKPLDWNYAVFKNDGSETEGAVGTASSNVASFDGNIQISENDITPSFENSPEPLRNIKSLKRTQSRGYPVVTSSQIKVKKEDYQELLKSPDYWDKVYASISNWDYASDTLVYLMSTQQKCMGTPNIPFTTRACVVNWIMKVNVAIDGNPAIVQTACWYMDSYLVVRSVRVEKLQLIASACFWIAQKLHGPNKPARRMVKYANNAFTARKLLAAEQSVLKNLRFPRRPVIPDEFISYLALLCDNDRPMKITLAATFLCMSGLMVTSNLCEELPSVVACAAIKTAVDLIGEPRMVQKLMPCAMYAETEKSPSFPLTCSVLQHAVLVVGDPEYDYKSPLNRYGPISQQIAEQIVCAVRHNHTNVQ